MSEKEKFQWFSRLKKGTKLEKILCSVTVASVLIIAVMIVTFVYLGYHNTTLGSKKMNLSNVCLTPGCVKAASTILSRIDETTDPCDDFYRFTCGQWLKTHAIPEDESSLSIVTEEIVNLNLRVKALIERKLDGTEPRFITMLKDLYDTCMDLESIENAGARPLKNILKTLGGWPVIEGNKWDESKFDWIKTMITLRKMGFPTLLNCYVEIDRENSSCHTLYLDESPLGMPSRTYLINGLNDAATAAYFKKMVKTAILFGADARIAETELLEALQFEMTIANYTYTRSEEDQRKISKRYNKYTTKQLQEKLLEHTTTEEDGQFVNELFIEYSIKELQETFPEVPWLKFINGFLKNEMHENETIIVSFPDFIEKLLDLITRTKKRVIANYICWRVVDNCISYLSKEWRDIQLEYEAVLYGASQEKPRWELCLPIQLDAALSSLYVRHYSNRETKDKVLQVVNYVYKEFLHILEDIDWMDEETKAHAKAKAHNMLFYIAYPDELLNNTIVLEYYHNLTTSKDSYFENFIRIKKWSAENNFNRLRKPNDRKDWKKYAYVVQINAFYLMEDNTIALPVGILHSPFYDKDQPNYMNFAFIGSFVGHEITHGFDDQGRHYDKDGNIVNWWESRTDENFQSKAQCIVDLYSNYTAENGMKLDGIRTLGENIADIAGLKESYLAYQSWIKDNGPEQLLPGIKYNQNQLFWINAAFGSCAKYRPEKLKELILTDVHSLDEFRVIGPNSNLPEFAKDFNCPVGSLMNRKHKCQVW